MIKTLIYFIFSLAAVFYALPRLPFLSENQTATFFSAIWLLFALLIVGAHLDHLLGLDEEKRKRLTKLKKYQLWRKEQKILKMQTRDDHRIKDRKRALG